MKERPIIFSGEMVRAILDDRKMQTRRILKCPHEIVDKATAHDWNVGKHPSVKRWEDGAGKDGSCHLLLTSHGSVIGMPCPYGQPDDRLWVRETWADVNTEAGPALAYRADGAIRTWQEFSESFGPDYGGGPSMDYDAYPGDYAMWWSDLLRGEPEHRWRSSIHMPRWAFRITLEITGIRVERVQDINEADSLKEGVTHYPCGHPDCVGPDGSVGMHYGPRAAFRRLWNSINAKRPGCSWEDNPYCWVIEFRRVE